MANDYYADRLARQAVVLALARQRYDNALAAMLELVRGTPPTYYPDYKDPETKEGAGSDPDSK